MDRNLACADSPDEWLEAHFSDVPRMKAIKAAADPDGMFETRFKKQYWDSSPDLPRDVNWANRLGLPEDSPRADWELSEWMTENKVKMDVDSVGAAGGICTCPNGVDFMVGTADGTDACGPNTELACIGGMSNGCSFSPNDHDTKWMGGSHVSVTCDLSNTFAPTAPTAPTMPVLPVPLIAATASYQEDSNPASNVLQADGRWGSWGDPDAPNGWLAVEFDQAWEVARLTIEWEGAFASKYKVQVATGDGDWVDATDITGNDVIESNGGSDEINFPGILADRLRIYGVEYDMAPGISIFTVSVGGWFVPLSPTAPTPSPTRAPTQTPTAPTVTPDPVPLIAATASYQEGGNPASNVLQDGGRWGSWGDPDAPNGWLEVQFDNLYDVSKVTIDWEAAYASKYKIQVATGDGDWVDATDVITSSGGDETVDFDGVLADKLRIYGVEYKLGGGMSIWKISVGGWLYLPPI
jgi:hypothetical protein